MSGSKSPKHVDEDSVRALIIAVVSVPSFRPGVFVGDDIIGASESVLTPPWCDDIVSLTVGPILVRPPPQ